MQSSPFTPFSSSGFPPQPISFQGSQYANNAAQYSQAGGLPSVPASNVTPARRQSARRSLAPASDAAAVTAPGSPQPSLMDVTMTSAYGDTQLGEDDPDGERAEGPVFHLPPPPEQTYNSIEDLDRALHAWSLEHGYELVRRASKKNTKGILYKRYYHCSRHGKLANTGRLSDATRVRFNRKSNRIGCPMSVAVVAVDANVPDGPWEIKHRKNWHNHGPEDGLALAGHRRRARMGGVEQQVDGLFAINTPTAAILQFLQRTNPTGLFTRTDVANMKLKYKKFGSCVGRNERDRASRAGDQSSEIASQADVSVISMPASTISVAAIPSALMPPPPRPVQSPVPMTPTQAVPIMADLQQYAAATIPSGRLSLQSSSVEVLAASCCGNGDSYRAMPILEHPEQWQSWKGAFLDACMKENTYEVLVGVKLEPTRPEDDCSNDVWNEYIRQLAIYNRRNLSLIGAVLSRTAGLLKRRVQFLKAAAAIWQTFIDMCEPRGSQLAFRLYDELHSISLANSRGMRDYIARLETAYNELNHTPRTPLIRDFSGGRRPTQSVEARTQGNTAHAPTTRSEDPSGVLSEGMLCFLFLRGLGPEFKRLSDTLCATANVDGFGTGIRLGFAEVTRSAIEWETTQRGGMIR